MTISQRYPAKTETGADDKLTAQETSPKPKPSTKPPARGGLTVVFAGAVLACLAAYQLGSLDRVIEQVFAKLFSRFIRVDPRLQYQ